MLRPLIRWLAAAVVCFTMFCPCRASEPAAIYEKPIADFALTERSGRRVTRADLRGKVWIASFIFTRCAKGCPQVTTAMARLQDELAGHKDIMLVTFTIDPEHDQPDELNKYAEHFHANPERWLFLTGKQDEIYDLVEHSFFLTVMQNEGSDRKPGYEVKHDPRLVLVDREGYVRSYCRGLPASETAEDQEDFEDSLRKLGREAITLSDGKSLPFPEINAILNTTCVFLLLTGYSAIRNRWIGLHKICMLTALAVSALFLASYLYYHIVVRHGQPTRFEDQAYNAPAAMRYVYLAILLSHTILAVVTAPLALFTAYQGIRNHLARHVRVARWTLPIWLYVSVTGVVVYWMLYRLYPPPG